MAKKRKKSKADLVLDKLSQKEFNKNYNDLHEMDQYYIIDVYSSLQTLKYNKQCL